MKLSAIDLRKTPTSNDVPERPPTRLMDGEVVVGVAALARKASRAPMLAIIAALRAADARISVLVFSEQLLLSEPITRWPVVHCLLWLSAGGFPLAKTEAYVRLRAPLVVNSLRMAKFLRDRRLVRCVLESAGVPLPRAVVVDRELGDNVRQEGDILLVVSAGGIVKGVLGKPFVEKPVLADDHRVHIYYRGGGVRELFRKTKRESSRYIPFETRVRDRGSFIYEQFYEPEECADVKVYGVGDYFHAEARKAPHIDGIVDRDTRGLERRVPVNLSPYELDICRKVALAFRQFVIGIDLLRGPGNLRFVIDVNGWSFVKSSSDYPTQCGKLLAQFITSNLQHAQQQQCPGDCEGRKDTGDDRIYGIRASVCHSDHFPHCPVLPSTSA